MWEIMSTPMPPTVAGSSYRASVNSEEKMASSLNPGVSLDAAAGRCRKKLSSPATATGVKPGSGPVLRETACLSSRMP